MPGELIKPSGAVKLQFKIKILYKNGASEVIFAIKPANINPVTPLFLDFTLAEGKMRYINMSEIRCWDLEVTQMNGGIIV